MLIPIAFVFLLLTVALLLAGTIGGKPAALYALKCAWFPGLVVAAYLTLGAWQDRAYSENWEFLGVLIFVLPYTGLVLLEGVLELIMLRGRRDVHAKRARIITSVLAGLLLAFSVIGILSA